MSNVNRTAMSTVTTLLGTINTAANVTTAGLTSLNIAARDLQERTESWSRTARIERKLNDAEAENLAITRYAQTQADRYAELQSWLTQNADRKAAFEQAIIHAKSILNPEQPK